MAYEEFSSPFVRAALAEIDGWAGPGSGLTLEKLGRLMWRVKLGGPEGNQIMFLRPAPAASHLEPYISEPSDAEVAQLKSRFTNQADVVYPYLRGGRGRGALLRVRNERDLAAIRDLVQARGKKYA